MPGWRSRWAIKPLSKRQSPGGIAAFCCPEGKQPLRHGFGWGGAHKPGKGRADPNACTGAGTMRFPQGPEKRRFMRCTARRSSFWLLLSLHAEPHPISPPGRIALLPESYRSVDQYARMRSKNSLHRPAPQRTGHYRNSLTVVGLPQPAGATRVMSAAFQLNSQACLCMIEICNVVKRLCLLERMG